MKIIDSTGLKQILDSDQPVQLLDVRTAEEVAINRLPKATHIPMHEITKRYTELDASAATVVYCHHGVRSHQVAAWLIQQGFDDVANLSGGIAAYAMTVDPSLGHY